MLGQRPLPEFPFGQSFWNVAAIGAAFHDRAQRKAALHRHAAALSEVWRLRMRGVAEDRGAPRRPGFDADDAVGTPGQDRRYPLDQMAPGRKGIAPAGVIERIAPA